MRSVCQLCGQLTSVQWKSMEKSTSGRVNISLTIRFKIRTVKKMNLMDLFWYTVFTHTLTPGHAFEFELELKSSV